MIEVVEPSIPYLLRTLSVVHGSMRAPRIIAQVTEYEIDKPYPDIPEWFMSPPNDMRISWYGNTYDFTLKPDFRGRNEWEIKPSTPNEHSDMNAVPNASTQ